MEMQCVVAKYVFICDEGKFLNRNKTESILAFNNPHFSEDATNVSFTVFDDNDTAKAQKLRGQLFYAQIEVD